MSVEFQATRLLGLPYVFTQDEILSSGEFAKEAQSLGFADVDEAMLQALHDELLLVPLFRVSLNAVDEHRIQLPAKSVTGHNPRGWVIRAAEDGALRNPIHEGSPSRIPYARPAGEDPRSWKNGYFFSSWQLLEFRRLRVVLKAAKRNNRVVGEPKRFETSVELDPRNKNAIGLGGRDLSIVLAALSNRFLPGITGRISLPSGLDQPGWETARQVPVAEVLGHLGAVPALKELAESLLLDAHSTDPLEHWLPLVRHANYRAWSRLKGPAQFAIRQRIAAEMLLRAHEELADAGEVQPLPDYSGSISWHPLKDRLGWSDERPVVDDALFEFGLHPNPRLIMLVEGETERLHVSRLLHLAGFGNSSHIRVQPLKGADSNPKLLAEYAISPRLGDSIGDGWTLTHPVTVLFIMVDEEGSWRSQEKRDRLLKSIKDGLKDEVSRQQKGEIDEDHLDNLLELCISRPCYELENFTEEEVLQGLLEATGQRFESDQSRHSWVAERKIDIGLLRSKKLGSKRFRKNAEVNAVRLAEALWPILQSKASGDWEHNEAPLVLRTVNKVISKAQRVSWVNAVAARMDLSAADK